MPHRLSGGGDRADHLNWISSRVPPWSAAPEPALGRSSAVLKRLHHIGGRLSDRIATVAGHSAAQGLVLLACGLWLVGGGSFDILSDILAVGGFALTQMVLNQQRRRDAALHLKIDELVLALEGARNEIAGSELRTEEEIAELRQVVD